MFAKYGNSRNKIDTKKLALYALLVAICLIVGYLENVLSITLITMAPGIKIGLSNAVALLLIYKGDIKGAWLINISRIALSALLFGSPISFLFSLSGGITSTAVTSLLSRVKCVSCVGASIAGGVVHNVFQLVAAIAFVGIGVMYYVPVLIALGAVCGAFCGFLALQMSKLKIIKTF